MSASTLSSPFAPSVLAGKSGFDIPIEIKYIDGRYEKINVRIRRVNTGFFRIAAPVHMPPGRRLALFYCGNRIEGSIVYSNRGTDGGFNVGISCGSIDAQGRRQPRLEAKVRGLLTSPDFAMPLRVKVVSLSRAGLGFLSPSELAVGSPICIEFDDYTAFGEVRHCTRMGRKYRAGCAVEEFIEFQGSARRSSGAFRRLWTTVRVFLSRKSSELENAQAANALAQQ